MEKIFCVYIITNKPKGVLYIGITSNLPKRICEHKHKVVKGFSQKYGLDQLVYYETHATAENAICREKNLKSWKRQWKINLIEKFNPIWKDLYHNVSSP